MRLLLALLVGLAQVAGPWLCCCAEARAATPVVAPAPVEECPLCGKKAPAKPDQPTLPEPCPCGGKAVLPAPPAKPEPVAVFDLDPPAVAGPADSPAAVLARPVAGVSELPFLPPGARLYVHHVLHC